VKNKDIFKGFGAVPTEALLSQSGRLRLTFPEKEVKPVQPKLQVRIRGPDELYKKIGPVKIDCENT